MRVVHVVHSAQPGGSNEVLLSMLRHRPPGVECACVFLQGGPMASAAERLGAAVAVVDAGRAREVWRVPRVVGALRGAIRAVRADAVMAHVAKAHLYAATAAGLEGVPYLWRQPARRGEKPLLHEVAGRIPAAAVICPSDFIAAEQRARWPRTPVLRVHPGREVGDLPPPRRHRAAAGDPLTLGIVGRLQRWKRVELALRALPAVLREAPAARLQVIGDAWPGLDDDYPAALRAEAARLGVAGAVDFRGHVPAGAAAIADLDLLVHTAELEPFGLVLIEAMLRGVPVVAPRSGGSAEIVRHEVDGLLVDVTQTDRLAQGILALAADPELRTRMGSAARARAAERFTAERAAGELWSVVRSVATGAFAPAPV